MRHRAAATPGPAAPAPAPVPAEQQVPDHGGGSGGGSGRGGRCAPGGGSASGQRRAGDGSGTAPGPGPRRSRLPPLPQPARPEGGRRCPCRGSMEVAETLQLGELAAAFAALPVFPLFDTAYFIVSVLYLKYEPGECGPAPSAPPVRAGAARGWKRRRGSVWGARGRAGALLPRVLGHKPVIFVSCPPCPSAGPRSGSALRCGAWWGI